MEFLYQEAVPFEQEVDGELLQYVGDVVVGWDVMYQSLHGDSVFGGFGIVSCFFFVQVNPPAYMLLLLRLTSFLRRSSFLSGTAAGLRCLLAALKRCFWFGGGF